MKIEVGRSLASGDLGGDEVWLMMNCRTERLAFNISVQTHKKHVFFSNQKTPQLKVTLVLLKETGKIRICQNKNKKKQEQKVTLFNFRARNFFLVSKVPSCHPEFRTFLRKILAGLEHSQKPVFTTEFKLGYNKIMSLMVITFSSGLRDWL